MEIKIRKPLCFSEIGRKDNQEDYLWPLQATTEQRVFIMCDGVGGQDSGEVASQTAATALGEWLTAHWPEDGVVTKEIFEAALSHAYDALDAADTADSVRKMGTTMTCVVLHNGGVLVAHIGDSRIYHIRPSLAVESRNGIIYQSCDHSLVNDLLRAGELTEEEARDFPRKNVITRAMQPHLERRCKADIYNLTDIVAGDYFFLCCDGVLERLTNDNLGRILATDASDAEKLAAIKAVCDEGTRDNYTCWLVPVDRVEGAVSGSDGEEVDGVEVEVEESDTETDNPVGQATVEPATILPSPKKTSKLPSLLLFLLALVAIIALGAWTMRDRLFPSVEQMDTLKTDTMKRDTVKPSPSAPVKARKDSAKTPKKSEPADAANEAKEDKGGEDESTPLSVETSHGAAATSDGKAETPKKMQKFNKTKKGDGTANR